IQQFDIDAYFDQLGLINHLSPSRGNGLKAIVEDIKSLAQ
ncbi:SufE family protein, partial [Photobacterium damselae subsp. damselae]|nr:SufE family protein [Photobacterium damselae subsp. damselae]